MVNAIEILDNINEALKERDWLITLLEIDGMEIDGNMNILVEQNDKATLAEIYEIRAYCISNAIKEYEYPLSKFKLLSVG